jgi:hypothetical protein
LGIINPCESLKASQGFTRHQSLTTARCEMSTSIYVNPQLNCGFT